MADFGLASRIKRANSVTAPAYREPWTFMKASHLPSFLVLKIHFKALVMFACIVTLAGCSSSPLEEFIATGDYESAQRFLKSGQRAPKNPNNGHLATACLIGNLEMVKLQISQRRCAFSSDGSLCIGLWISVQSCAAQCDMSYDWSMNQYL